uniref:Immunoglobulin V-set domain-containing protein n=1 Tax=Paramormyrops kingsleyae TaxID=1676925 RepID=A0A3B3SZU9_9TELE
MCSAQQHHHRLCRPRHWGHLLYYCLDDPDQPVFTVTMNNLTAGDSGYYWCGVEISGDSDVGTLIQLSVTEGKMSSERKDINTNTGENVFI